MNQAITLQKAYQKLERTLLLHNRALDQLQEGVAISDPTQPDNPLIYVNDAFLRLTAYDREEIIGQNARFLQGEGTDPAAIKKIRKALDEKETITIDILNYRKNGESFWNCMTISPVFNEASELINFVGIQRDITRIKDLERENKQLKHLVGTLTGK